MDRKWIIRLVVLIIISTVLILLLRPKINEMQKDTYLNNFESFVEKVKENHNGYSANDWERIDEEYQELSVQERVVHEKLFTKEDEKKISSLEGEYSSYRTSGFIDNVIEKTKDVINNAAEYVDGFMKGLNNTIESDTTDE